VVCTNFAQAGHSIGLALGIGALDAPENKREAPGTTNRSFDLVPLGHEPFPKIERVDE
jgi:hypothetical protein